MNTPLTARPAPYRANAPETSVEAAHSLSRDHLARAAQEVYNTISTRRGYGATMDEICLTLDGDLARKNSISARLNGLYMEGRIRRAGKRPGRSGRSQAVWLATK